MVGNLVPEIVVFHQRHGPVSIMVNCIVIYCFPFEYSLKHHCYIKFQNEYIYIYIYTVLEDTLQLYSNLPCSGDET